MAVHGHVRVQGLDGVGSVSILSRLKMKIGDLVRMPGSIEPITGIVLREERPEDAPRAFSARTKEVTGPAIVRRVEVYWIEDAESSWEPVKWLKVINESR